MALKQNFRPWPAVLQLAVVVLLVIPFVSATFRDNDQATILGGSWQIAHSQASFLHASFYNFDKQWGMYLLLSWLFRAFPHADPILAGNILIAILASIAWLSLGIRTGRTRHAPLPLLLPILLSPTLILYIPFLGSGWFSLAFLLLAFFFLGRMNSKPSQGFGMALVAMAAACRGDVILAMPALTLSLLSRHSLSRLLRRPLPWALAAAAVLPVLLGKQLAGVIIPDVNPLSFTARSYFGFLLFGLTPAALLLLLASIGTFSGMAWRKQRFAFFYVALALTPLIPFAFYSIQLYTLRYLFLTLASLLFVAASRRSTCIYRSAHRSASRDAILVALTVIPWLMGLQLPLLNRPQITVRNPTRFPTGDGEFPMFGYLAFDWQVLFRDHLAIDHNQRIWLAARSVDYQPCPSGTVPFLITPMSNYLDLAIRFQKKVPRPLESLAESPCGIAYVDARSVLRGFRPEPRDAAFFQRAMKFDSHVDDGQIIVRIDAQARQSLAARTLQDLRNTLGPRYVETYLDSHVSIPVGPGIDYVVFSAAKCRVNTKEQALSAAMDGLIQAHWTGARKGLAEVACPATPLSGWARTAYPPYMDGLLLARP